LRALIGAPRASRRSTICRWPFRAAWLRGRAPNRSRASTEAPPSNSSVAKLVQPSSAAENSASDTSIALNCAFSTRNRLSSPWHRSESEAQAANGALSTAITLALKNRIWRHTIVLPRQPFLQDDTDAQVCQTAWPSQTARQRRHLNEVSDDSHERRRA
jgi:hypothetical protein